ncbi:MAG: Stp1/IreP family PP2C-type Ser/Thr phosphatase [Elusimicrobia bacterium]|nr:Stp1/IreP family PP2C-type Ser/Thr phosphatase [Elusimicrobiota bacterium]MDE2314644.1 Stp1/IreP family PP2C-type Ser/Thr phosphatase [Elusimicrobiota bacterium]
MSGRKTAGALRLDLAGATDRGLVRAQNEDAFAFDAELRLLVVADGMGGHRAGEVASAMAVGAVAEGAKTAAVFPDEEPAGACGPSARARALESLIAGANAEIHRKSLKEPSCAGMGTTVAAAWVGRRSAALAHVGDSRIYLCRGKTLSRLTRDHTWTQERVRAGAMTEAEAASSGLSNVLTRALGTEPEVKADLADEDLRAGDVLLLATDGLTKMLKDEEIAGILAAGQDAAGAAQSLVLAANAAGGEDNVTVVVARAL